MYENATATAKLLRLHCGWLSQQGSYDDQTTLQVPYSHFLLQYTVKHKGLKQSTLLWPIQGSLKTFANRNYVQKLIWDGGHQGQVGCEDSNLGVPNQPYFIKNMKVIQGNCFILSFRSPFFMSKIIFISLIITFHSFFRYMNNFYYWHLLLTLNLDVCSLNSLCFLEVNTFIFFDNIKLIL